MHSGTTETVHYNVYVCLRSVKLWDLRRTYSICRLEPPLSWHSFTPIEEPGRRFGKQANSLCIGLYVNHVSVIMHICRSKITILRGSLVTVSELTFKSTVFK